MKRLSFFQGVIVAALFALISSIAFAGLSIAIDGTTALKIVSIALGGGYIVYLLHRSNEHIGRIAVFTTWLLITMGTWLFTADVFATVITQTLLISVVRGLYHHTFVLAGLLDFVLSAFALSAAVWASDQSGSMFLTVWSFFLVQALSAGIPTSFARSEEHDPATTSSTDDNFVRAFRTAETAITRIATQR